MENNELDTYYNKIFYQRFNKTDMVLHIILKEEHL